MYSFAKLFEVISFLPKQCHFQFV